MGRAQAWPLSALCALLVALMTPAVHARPRDKETPALDAKRDAVLARLLEGDAEEFAAAVDDYKALLKERDPIIPTSFEAHRAWRERLADRRAFEEAYRKTADHEVAWRCRLSTDPKSPHPMVDGWRGDWGKVTRRQKVRLPPKNALDEGEEWELYEVVGQARTYRFRSHRFGVGQRDFTANVGDLVLVCDGGRTTLRKLPEDWAEDFQSTGFAVKLERPPKIAQKARWRPLHITDNALFWAVKDVRWKFPPEDHVVSVIDVREDLGGGRFLVDTLQDITFIAEVPPGTPNAELLVPDRKAWAIMGNARFDRELKALVLTVKDVEARYVEEASPPDDE